MYVVANEVSMSLGHVFPVLQYITRVYAVKRECSILLKRIIAVMVGFKV